MTETFRRILVAVDASPLSVAAMEAAATLAGRAGAELEAVFVEDINVVRLVAHPYVHTFSLSAARRQAADDVLIEKALELQMVAARRSLERVLDATAARGSFAVRRGRVEVELLAAAREADLVCLGWSGRAEPGARPRLGSVARALAAAADPPVMMLRRRAFGPVAVLWDGSQEARRALAVAVGLAARGGTPVTLLVSGEAAGQLAEAVAWLDSRGVAVRLAGTGGLARQLAGLAPDAVLVVPAEAGLPFDESPCSLVVVR